MASSSDSRTGPAGVRWWLAGCWIAGSLLFLSQLAEIPQRSALRGYDNTFNYLWLRSAMVDGDWDFRNDLVACNTLTAEYRAAALALPVTETGRIPNKYGVGWSVVTLPFYAAADAVVATGRLLGLWTLERDGFNPVYQLFIQTGHAGLAILALVLAVRVVRGWVGPGATLGVLMTWAASPLLFYQTSNLSMSHGTAFFAVTLGAYGLQRAGADGGKSFGWLLAGVGFGLAAVTRFQLVVFALLPGWTLVGLWRKEPAAARTALAGLMLGGLPFVCLQLAAWKVTYGHWFVFSYGAEGEGFNWLHPELGRSLFSSWHGLYYWHPLLLLATVGLFGWMWSQRAFAVPVGLAFAATWYLNAAWWCWWFASAFGHRAYDAAVLPLMAGMAWLVGRATGRWRIVLYAVAMLAALWNLRGLILYRTGSISRSEAVTWSQMWSAGLW